MEREHPGVFIRRALSRVPNIEASPTSIAAFVGSFPKGRAGVPTDVHSVEEFEQLFGANGTIVTEASIAVHDFFANGGTHAVVVASSFGGTRSSAEALIRSLAMLSAAPLAQVVCMPDMARRVEPFDDDEYAELLLRATVFCRQNRMFLLVDPNTRGDTIEDINVWLKANPTWGSPNNAVYFPRLHTPASRVGGTEAVAASGAVAGVMARTDEHRGVWKAPAGTDAAIDAVVAINLSDMEQSPLNRSAVNVIRHFEPTGTVIWGSRTGAGSVASADSDVAGRRTALFIEQSLHQGLVWATLEPNSRRLWTSIRTAVKVFMIELWRDGAFVGDKQSEAFLIRCDASTMSETDRRRGRTVIEIDFAPARPADFVTITVTLSRPEP